MFRGLKALIGLYLHNKSVAQIEKKHVNVTKIGIEIETDTNTH